MWRLERESTKLHNDKKEGTRTLVPHPSFSFVSTDIRPAGADPFGMILGSAPRVRGLYVDLNSPDVQSETFKFTEVRRGLERSHSKEQVRYFVDMQSLRIRIWFDYVLAGFRDVKLRCLLLLQRYSTDTLGRRGDCQRSVGIVLRARGDGEGDSGETVFEKIGIFSVDRDDLLMHSFEGGMRLV